MGDMPNPEDEKLTAPPDKPVDRVLPETFSNYPPSEPWIVRRLIKCRKSPLGRPLVRWSQEPIPVRFGPYPRARPPGRLTEWRAVRATSGTHTFSMLCMAQPTREDFRAWLVLGDEQKRSVIERWEYHGAHTPFGNHSHTWCAEPHPPSGPLSIDAPCRLPGSRNFHRLNSMPWSKETFWVAACRRYSIALAEIDQGELI
jgi:hypothetical protein